LWGILPIADAFIAWSNGLEATVPMVDETPWRRIFQLYSLLTASAVLLALIWVWQKPKRKEKGTRPGNGRTNVSSEKQAG
jgi:hypothetical protein